MEEWKDIKGFGNFYKISNYGRVKNEVSKILRTYLDSNGYIQARFTYDKNKKSASVHRLVALYFLENENNHIEVNHKDGNKKNNNVNNLEWCSRSENLKHAYKTGLKIAPKGTQNNQSKLNEEQVKKILTDKSKNKKFTNVYKEYEHIISKGTFNSIWTRKTWKHVEYIM
jgi:ribosomal protein L18